MTALATGAPAPAATDNPPADELDEIEDEDADESAYDETTDDDTEPEATESGAAPVSAEPIVMPSLDSAPFQPVFAGLASIIPTKGTLLLAIAKLANGDLRVTVQPPPAPDEPAETVLPLTVTGTAEELDAEFVNAFAVYKPSREYATASAAEIARQTKVAADKARNEAEARRNKTTTSSVGRKPSGTLTITTTPADAAIKIAANDGKTRDAKSGQKLTLPVGKATITATLAGRNTKLATVTIANGKDETLALDLPAAEPSLFT
jgi:PRTRC genetic system protein E